MNGQKDLQSDLQKDEAFEGLLRFMRDTRGFDFTGHKRTSLMRPVRHRMEQAGYETFDQYLDVLQASADEFVALFNTILINVTSFFRDPDAWDFVRDDVIPMILAERGPDDPIRVWSAGCASGQEADTLAMLLAEALGPDATAESVLNAVNRRGRETRVRVTCTDFRNSEGAVNGALLLMERRNRASGRRS